MCHTPQWMRYLLLNLSDTCGGERRVEKSLFPYSRKYTDLPVLQAQHFHSTAPGPYGDQDSRTAGQGCASHFFQHAALRNSWFVSTCTAWKVQEATSPRQGRQQPLRLTQRETPSSRVAPWSSESRHLLLPPHPHPKPLALNERQHGQYAEAC